jgi:predicted GIY-YIG superfamily endonuclease
MTRPEVILKWSREKCFEAAKKCNSKSEFLKKYCGAYSYAKKHGFLSEIQQNFEIIGSKYNRCIYVCEFPNKNVYVGLTYNFENRKKQHLNDIGSSVFKYIKETNLLPNFKQITEYVGYKEASILEGEILEKYKNDGWKILNRVKTGGLGSKDAVISRKWTKEKCIETINSCKTYKELWTNYSGMFEPLRRYGLLEEAKNKLNAKTRHAKWTKNDAIKESKKYGTIKELMKDNYGLYSFMLKHNLRDEMRKGKKILSRDKWTLEDAKKEALKYSTKKEFMEKALGCYEVCAKRKWIDEVCSHMRNLVEERKIYNEQNVIETIKKFSSWVKIKKNEEKFIRGCYWWSKTHNKVAEYTKYLQPKNVTRKGIIWTQDKIENEYKKMPSYKSFKENIKLYDAARRRKMLKEIKKYFNGKK